MIDILDFLKARLDEDADAQREPYCSDGWHANDCAVHYDDWAGAEQKRDRPEPCDCGVPARVLLEVEAKRRLLAKHVEAVEEQWDQGDERGLFDVTVCNTCAYGQSCNHCFDRSDLPLVEWPCPELRLLALPYSRHPEYQASWKP